MSFGGFDKVGHCKCLRVCRYGLVNKDCYRGAFGTFAFQLFDVARICISGFWCFANLSLDSTATESAQSDI